MVAWNQVNIDQINYIDFTIGKNELTALTYNE